jgi:uncharacterized membrane protein YgcG
VKHLFFFFWCLFGIATFGQSQESIVLDKNQDSLVINQSERILSFKSNIVVGKNASLIVTETIKVIAKGEKIKRGIFRSLPETRNLNGKNFRVKYDIIAVKKDGLSEDYHVQNENGYENIYIGNKDIFLPVGIYEYEITYKTDNQIGFFDKYDELYWNVNGNAWDFAVDTISATVSLPSGASILQYSCYTGVYGSKSQNCISEKISNNRIFWAANNLNSEEGLTIAVGFNKGVILPPPPPGFLKLYGVLIFSILAFIGLMIYFYKTWSEYGVDPQAPVVYPQFNTPQNLSPASLGYLKEASFSNRLITASIVNLAVKGYLKITERDDSQFFGLSSAKVFTLEKLKNSDVSLPKEESLLMDKLFAESDFFEIEEKYDAKVKYMLDDFKSNLKFQHNAFLDEGNNRFKLGIPALIISAVYGVGLFFCDTEKIVIGLWLYFLLLFFFVLFTFIVKGYSFSSRFAWFMPFGLFCFISRGVHFNFDTIEDGNYFICYVFLVLSFISFVIYSYLIRKPSKEKLETLSLIEGYKMYIGAAESEQLKFHNPPTMTPELFEKILPFAIVLGVDEIWGQKFSNMLKLASMTYQNNWYYGNHFNSSSFGKTFYSNLSNSIASASTQQSSGGSGSGGGGSSGGGGGGGGGGGW